MPICERVVCQESRRGHTDPDATRRARSVIRARRRRDSWRRQASSEKTQDQRTARARPRPRGAPWTRAGRPHAPAARGGRRRRGRAVATPARAGRHRRVRETRGRKNSRRAGLQTRPRRPGRCRVRRPDREGALVSCAQGPGSGRTPAQARMTPAAGHWRGYGREVLEKYVLTKTYQWLWLMRLCVTH